MPMFECQCLNDLFKHGQPMFECPVDVQTSAFKHWRPMFEWALPTNMYDYMLHIFVTRKSNKIIVGQNVLADRLCIPNSKVPLTLLSLSQESVKIKC